MVIPIRGSRSAWGVLLAFLLDFIGNMKMSWISPLLLTHFGMKRAPYSSGRAAELKHRDHWCESYPCPHVWRLLTKRQFLLGFLFFLLQNIAPMNDQGRETKNTDHLKLIIKEKKKNNWTSISHVLPQGQRKRKSLNLFTFKLLQENKLDLPDLSSLVV